MDSPSLNAKNKPSWRARLLRGVAAQFAPELFEQERGIQMTRFGLLKTVRTKDGRAQVGEIEGSGNQFVIERPGGGTSIDPARLLENNKGFVFASVNAKAREVMVIDWRLFEVDGENHKERTEHELLDLLDEVNPDMTGLELKYLTSAHLDLTGNAYWFLQGVNSDLDTPKAIYLMPVEAVRPVIDRRQWPHRVVGYKMRLANHEYAFKPYEILHFRLPNPSNFFEGVGPTQAGAEYIDNDHYAMEFNRKFFRNGARPAGFLETEMVAETQMEAIKIGFAAQHEGIDNMNRIGVLPKGVKWAGVGSNPKDMDFKNLSEDMRDRILAMYGVSRTILGTAESDTNRATAETADYVFSKRVVKPHMLLICAFLNERLVQRYGDDLYISFIDPVPEDKAARTEEMKAGTAGQPVLTANEARKEFLGLGPVDGGDTLMVSTTMTPIGSPSDDTDPNPEAPGTAEKPKTIKTIKAANGQRVAFRPVRLKLQTRAKQRRSMAESLAKSIAEKLKANLATKKYASTKEQDELRWKEFSDFAQAAEKDIAQTIRKINVEQKKEVLEHLPDAIKKAIDPADLFDIKHWISITIDAFTPIMETLFAHEARAALAEIGKPDMEPMTEDSQAALHDSVSLLAKSYNQTTLDLLEEKINQGLSEGLGLDQISKSVEDVYEWSDNWRADRVAKTEAFRTSNTALKTAWQQSGVVKTVRWYTAKDPCPFCQQMDGKIISVDENFFNQGDTITAGEGDNAQSITLDYSDVGSPPLHVNCMCFIRPSDVSLD